MKKATLLAAITVAVVAVTAPAQAAGPSSKSTVINGVTFTVSQFDNINYNVSTSPKVKKITRAQVAAIALKYGAVTKSDNTPARSKTYTVSIDQVVYNAYVMDGTVYNVYAAGSKTPLK